MSIVYKRKERTKRTTGKPSTKAIEAGYIRTNTVVLIV
jgi:hypothetical protein